MKDLILDLLKQYPEYISHYKHYEEGGSILLMDALGRAFGRCYWYNDDMSIIYLDWLSVEEECRNKKMATKLQVVREEIGKLLGAEYSMLYVDKGSWMKEWYEKRGYEYWENYDEEYIWMKKVLT